MARTTDELLEALQDERTDVRGYLETGDSLGLRIYASARLGRLVQFVEDHFGEVPLAHGGLLLAQQRAMARADGPLYLRVLEARIAALLATATP